MILEQENQNQFETKSFSSTESLISISGWLKQKTSPFKFEDQRFYVITEAHFIISKDSLLQQIESKIPLSSIESAVLLPVCSQSGFYFIYNFQKFSFYCSSTTLAQKWICAFQAEPILEKVDIHTFDLLNIIGVGSTAKVYLAQHKTSEVLYAIKVIEKDCPNFDNNEKMICVERKFLLKAKHPFICRLFYAFQSSSKVYLVFEYAPGGDLRHHIGRVRFSTHQIKLYLAEIVLALRALHQMDVFYRDLKPENILIDEFGHIKLADFGLSALNMGEDQNMSFCGTLEYISPEVLKRQNQTFVMNWWSFGVLTYFLLVGYLPF
jgi:tRNA A-37 threonylcarbamoyl transferase component Bud32